ncbi:MAG: LutC/YkgG family protein [Pyrinomonadaceae bacterium]
MAEREHNNETRRAMLTSIRQQLAASAPFDAVRSEHHPQAKVTDKTGHVAVAVDGEGGSLVERFQQALEAVSGNFIAAGSENEAAQAIQQIIERTKALRIAVSDSPLAQRIIAQVKSDALVLENAGTPALFDCDAGITGAQWAIAETGTLVLESDHERHRLSSLVPRIHIAIVESGRIRQTLGEVLQILSQQGQEGLSRTVTFITGPSRTSDIELTLAIGVHGPAELYVIVLKGCG